MQLIVVDYMGQSLRGARNGQERAGRQPVAPHAHRGEGRGGKKAPKKAPGANLQRRTLTGG